MAEEGLFSNLKFTDIFFPAAASLASAYNPHIGRGLNTGMDLFNSLAAFQHNVKGFKQQQKEWDLEQERIAQAQEAAGGYAGFVDKQITDRQEVARKAARAELDGDTTFGVHGPEGPAMASVPEPMSEEDMKQRFSEVATQIAPQEFDVFGGTQLPGPSLEEQFAETAAPRTSEALPWLLDEKMQAALAEDPEYAAMLQQQAATNLAGGTLAASPGSSIATLGNIALGGTGAAQERARIANVYKEIEGQNVNNFMRGQVERQARHKDALELQETITAQKAERHQAYGSVMADIIGMSKTIETMSQQEAGEEVRRMSDVIQKMKLAMDPDDPEFMNAWMVAHEYLNRVRAVSQGIQISVSEVGGNTVGGTEAADPEAARRAREVQERLSAINGGGV